MFKNRPPSGLKAMANYVDKELEDKEKNHVLSVLNKQSEHFKPGTYVNYKGSRWLVINYHNDKIVMGQNEGELVRIVVVVPQFMKNRSNNV